MKYRPEIDGLRALAVMPVVLFHAGFSSFSGGFVGVDIFFVISGYLITTIIIEDIVNKRFSIIEFYERRARRIIPALFFVMIVCIPFALLWMLPSQIKEFSKSIVAVSLLISNILFWKESDYFDTAAEEKPLLHTWSLAVEEQYYILFPIFLILTWRFGKTRVLWMIILITVISLLLSEWGWRNKDVANFYLLPTRAWELLAGSIAAFHVMRCGVQRNNHLALLGLMAIIFSIFAYDKNTPFPSFYTLVPILGVLLIVLYADKGTFIARFLGAKVFVGIGLISYSAYLWHQPIFAFAKIRQQEQPSELEMLVLSAFSFMLGYFSWKYIEKYFRNGFKGTKKFIVQASIIWVCLITIGYLGYKFEGFERLLLNDKELVLYQSIKRSSAPGCEHGVDECFKKMGSQNNKVMLLLGDSNADHFSSGLKELAKGFDYEFFQLTYPGCMPLSKLYRLDQSPRFNKDCILFNDLVGKNIDEMMGRIDVVVISSSWLHYFYGADLLREARVNRNMNLISHISLSIDGKNEINDHEKYEIFSKYLKELFLRLKVRADNVIVVGPLPPAVMSFNRKASFFNPDEISANEYFRSVLTFNNLIADVTKKSKVSYIDIARELCEQEKCRLVSDGQYFYHDSTHLSDYGQKKIIIPLIKSKLISINLNE